MTFIGDRHTYVGLVPICQHPFEARRLAGVAATATSLLGALLQRASVYPLLYCLLSAAFHSNNVSVAKTGRCVYVSLVSKTPAMLVLGIDPSPSSAEL